MSDWVDGHGADHRRLDRAGHFERAWGVEDVPVFAFLAESGIDTELFDDYVVEGAAVLVEPDDFGPGHNGEVAGLEGEVVDRHFDGVGGGASSSEKHDAEGK